MDKPLTPVAIIGQVILFGAFAAAIGYFSSYPKYEHLAPGQAVVKLSFSYHGKQIGECHDYTPEELKKLAPNMRATRKCSRERSPIAVEMDLDGKPIVRKVVPPTGLGKDGSSTVYGRFVVPTGEHLLSVRINDDKRVQGFTITREEKVNLEPGEVMVVDLLPDQGVVLHN